MIVCACAIPPQVMTCPVSSSAECAVDADHTNCIDWCGLSIDMWPLKTGL